MREKINYAVLSAQFSKFSTKIHKNPKLLPYIPFQATVIKKTARRKEMHQFASPLLG